MGGVQNKNICRTSEENRTPEEQRKSRKHVNILFNNYKYDKGVPLSNIQIKLYKHLIYMGILFYSNRSSMQDHNGGLSVELYDLSMFYSFKNFNKCKIAECEYTQKKINFMNSNRNLIDILVFNAFTQKFFGY